MEKCGYELSDVARLIGKSESYIRNIMRLDSLPNDVKEMVKRGELSASHARAISVAADPTKLAHEIINNNMSVAATEKMVKGTGRRSTSRAYTSKTIDSDTVHEIESRISTVLSVPVKLQEKRGGAGQIVLSFATRMQMYDLVEKITGQKV